jgi:methyl-accepting chemotaxis protein
MQEQAAKLSEVVSVFKLLASTTAARGVALAARPALKKPVTAGDEWETF